MSERVLLRDALSFIRSRSGFEFEARTAQRWCEAGCIEINGQQLRLASTQVNRRWFVLRESVEQIIAALNSTVEAFG